LSARLTGLPEVKTAPGGIESMCCLLLFVQLVLAYIFVNSFITAWADNTSMRSSKKQM
jgi:hypothetical protein